MSYPVCGDSCFYEAEQGSTCGSTDFACLCVDQTYLKDFLSCIRGACDASDVNIWIADGKARCSSAGVTFSSTATSAAATNQQTLTVTSAGTTSTFVTVPASTSVPHTSSHRKGGLSTGAKAGIAIGAVVGFLLLALRIFLRYRRRSKKKQQEKTQEYTQTSPESQPQQTHITTGYQGMQQTYQQVQPVGIGIHETDGTEKVYPYTETKSVSVTTTPVPLPTTLANFQQNRDPLSSSTIPTFTAASPASSAPQQGYDYHGQYPVVPELGENNARMTRPWSDGTYELDHSVQRAEIGGIVPLEADSRVFNPAQELNSSPSSQEPQSIGGTTLVRGDSNDDAELDRIKNEIERLRVEKDRIKSLQAIEERERELSRKIVERELSNRNE